VADRLLGHEPQTAHDELWDLENLARARRLCDWMFDQFEWAVTGSVVEIGAGIGTFSERLLAAGAANLLLIEPEPTCAEVLERRFGRDPRVRVVRETLPDAASLADSAASLDFALCQNVLEHVEEDAEAVAAIGRALRTGGRLTLLVPAHPRLFGSLDRVYGHHRRYTRDRVRWIVEGAGLALTSLYSFNLLGIPGWWMKSKTGARTIGAGPLAIYEALVRVWRPLEQRIPVPWGLSLVAHAEKR
jgi:SAM-dependent methyltransferase